MLARMVLLVVVSALVAGCSPAARSGRPLLVYAAASLRDVGSDLAIAFERLHGTAVDYNFAGSNTLAQQIRATSRGDVFLAADRQWIDQVEQAGRVIAGSRRAFLANRLVAVRHRDSALRLDSPRDLASARFRALALADPEAVPAGRYAREALQRAAPDLWPHLAGRVVPALDVRAALALVASDPEIVGVVYRTDVAASDRVRVLFDFASDDEPSIVYWAVALRSSADPDISARFLDFLGQAEAREVYRRHGFLVANE